MEKKTKLGHFSGSVLIAKQGEVILNKGYGMANLKHEINNTPQTNSDLALQANPLLSLQFYCYKNKDS
ncbi:hypothetical protein [Paenibacillus agri]|uniref:Uncharacterized protein n=1 Tax=Paenibacillus agri TaxID=2744309 RepID=A0A850EVA6_9BACL|nr:hypothetical protein [Paenibacillus agri]NUU62772.1 hypothetical protein [Paenibacillus agri]